MRTPIEIGFDKFATGDGRFDRTTENTSVTVVIPCYNEEEVLRSSYAELDGCTRAEHDVSWTFLFVDDGSSDRTWSLLRDLRRADPRVRLIRLSRNFGHQAALAAGIDHAAADAVIVMDADLQDPPEVICQFLARWKSGFDIVFGRRVKRDGEPPLRRFFTAAFYALANALTTIRLEPQVGDFYLLDRRVVAQLRKCRDQRPFLRGTVQWLGFSKCAIDYERHPRWAGRSKYTWTKLFSLARDCFTAFGINPFPAVLTVATIWFIAALSLLAATHDSKWFLGAIAGAVLAGQMVTLLVLILIGHFVWAGYDRANRRPTYVIDHLDPAYARGPGPFDYAECIASELETEVTAGGAADE